MKIFRCDRCGIEGTTRDGNDFVENWETVTVSESFHYDICVECAPALFVFLSRIDSKEQTPNVELSTVDAEIETR
jgi:hypothetical protein